MDMVMMGSRKPGNSPPGSRGRSAADNALHAQICAWMADPDPDPKLPLPVDAWLAIQERAERYVAKAWKGLSTQDRENKAMDALENAIKCLCAERESGAAMAKWAHVDAQVEALDSTIATLETVGTATPEALASTTAQLQEWVEAGGAIHSDQGSSEALDEVAATVAVLQTWRASKAPVPDLAGTVAVLEEWHTEGQKTQRGQHWGAYVHNYIRGQKPQGAERWIPEAEKFVREVQGEVKGRTLSEAVDVAIRRSHTYRSETDHRQQFDCRRGVNEFWITQWAVGLDTSVEADAEMGEDLVADEDTATTGIYEATHTPDAVDRAEEALEQLGWTPDSDKPAQVWPEPVVAFLEQQGRLADLVRQGWELRDVAPAPIDPAHLTRGAAAQVRELVPPHLQGGEPPIITGEQGQLGFGL